MWGYDHYKRKGNPKLSVCVKRESTDNPSDISFWLRNASDHDIYVENVYPRKTEQYGRADSPKVSKDEFERYRWVHLKDPKFVFEKRIVKDAHRLPVGEEGYLLKPTDTVRIATAKISPTMFEKLPDLENGRLAPVMRTHDIAHSRGLFNTDTYDDLTFAVVVRHNYFGYTVPHDYVMDCLI